MLTSGRGRRAEERTTGTRLRSGQLAHEVSGLGTPASTKLDGEDHEATPAGSDKLRVGALLVLAREGECSPAGRAPVSARLGGAGEGGHKGGVDSQLHAAPEGQAIRHDLEASVVSAIGVHIEVAEQHVRVDSRPGLPANPGSSSLKRSGSGAQGA